MLLQSENQTCSFFQILCILYEMDLQYNYKAHNLNLTIVSKLQKVVNQPAISLPKLLS